MLYTIFQTFNKHLFYFKNLDMFRKKNQLQLTKNDMFVFS